MSAEPSSRADVAVPSKSYRLQYEACWPEVVEVLRRVFLEEEPILGASVSRFEHAFAAYCGRARAVGVNSGTDALVLTLRALGIGPGDEVVTQANTFIATVAAIAAVGARPVLVDVDESSMNLDARQLDAVINDRTKAVIPVHLYGQLCDMSAIGAVCARRGVAIVEDAAQAHGASQGGVRAGAFGKAGCFSFHPSKNLGAFGDAGIIVLDDHAMADSLGELRNLGKRGKHDVAHLSGNSKLDTLQAALLLMKLPSLDRENARRRELAAIYDRELTGVADLVRPQGTDQASHAVHLYVVRTSRRDELKRAFAAAGIKFSMHYPIPPHLQELSGVDLGYRRGDFPVTERIAEMLVSLPIAPELTEAQIHRVCEVIRDALA